jgi:hypothetical protein
MSASWHHFRDTPKPKLFAQARHPERLRELTALRTNRIGDGLRTISVAAKPTA